MGNSFGRLLRVSTFGESHGPALGVVIDGFPPRLPIQMQILEREMQRRRPGQSRLTTQRQEGDTVEVLSGVEWSDEHARSGLSTGTSIALLIRSADARGKDYSEMRAKFRPSHADFTYQQKYGIRSVEGGGRSSARETAARVAAGALAQSILDLAGIEVVAWVDSVQAIRAQVTPADITLSQVEATPVRCPDPLAAQEMIAHIDRIRKDGDSVGGVIGLVCRGVPVGLGAPVFDKLEADLAKAMLSIPAAKGFEVGSGFAGTQLLGSEHNDAIEPAGPGRARTRTNYSGGIQGGISNGEHILARVAFKPTATILKEQDTVTVDMEATTLRGRGRHDPCVLPRAVPIVEAMARLVLADHMLLHRGQVG